MTLKLYFFGWDLWRVGWQHYPITSIGRRGFALDVGPLGFAVWYGNTLLG